jgi:hypothetical protein
MKMEGQKEQEMLTDDLIAKIGNGLDAMPAKPASRREIEMLLARIEAKIRTAQERGSTYAEIAKQITESGYPIKTSTLRVALQRCRKKEPGAKRAARRNSTEAPIATAASANATATQPPKAQRT